MWSPEWLLRNPVLQFLHCQQWDCLLIFQRRLGIISEFAVYFVWPTEMTSFICSGCKRKGSRGRLGRLLAPSALSVLFSPAPRILLSLSVSVSFHKLSWLCAPFLGPSTHSMLSAPACASQGTLDGGGGAPCPHPSWPPNNDALLLPSQEGCKSLASPAFRGPEQLTLSTLASLESPQGSRG